MMPSMTIKNAEDFIDENNANVWILIGGGWTTLHIEAEQWGGIYDFPDKKIVEMEAFSLKEVTNFLDENFSAFNEITIFQNQQ